MLGGLWTELSAWLQQASLTAYSLSLGSLWPGRGWEKMGGWRGPQAEIPERAWEGHHAAGHPSGRVVASLWRQQ